MYWKNKRAVGGIIVSLVFTFIILVILIFITSSVSLKVSKIKEKIIKAKTKEISIDNQFIKLLNMPIKYENTEITLKDLLLIDLYEYTGQTFLKKAINMMLGNSIFDNLNLDKNLNSYDMNKGYSFVIYRKVFDGVDLYWQVYSYNDIISKKLLDAFTKEIIIREIFTMDINVSNSIYKISYIEVYTQ